MGMSDLRHDLVEEVMLRVPLTSFRAVRSTCKNWNTLSKNLSCRKIHDLVKAKEATKHEFLAIMLMDFKVYLMRLYLRGVDSGDDVESSIKREAKLISVNDVDGVDISRVFHCSGGLLLCITKEYNPRLVVWNPCCGQPRWIEPGHSEHKKDYNYAFGYVMKNEWHRTHKILRYLEVDMSRHVKNLFCESQIYNLDSNLWEVVQDPRWNLPFHQCGVSLKGNTYWFVQSQNLGGSCFLLCFDFTRERFRSPLSMPTYYVAEDTVSLSTVRDEQLAVLFQRRGASHMEIWITDEIKPSKVRWRRKLFLAVNINPLTCYQHPFELGSFFVDEEKRVAVVFGRDMDVPDDHFRYAAYINGKDGYLKKVDLGESTSKFGCPVMGSTYVPSLVQIKEATPRGNQNYYLVH